MTLDAGQAAYTVVAACTACGACLLTCPEHAFVVGVPLQVRHDRCTDCGECVEICPADAIVRTPPPPAPLRPADHGAGAHRARSGGGHELHDRRRRGGA